MTEKLELKSCHEVIDTVYVANIESVFHGKPTDPDILTVVMKNGKKIYCDEVCPVDSLQEEPISEELEKAGKEWLAQYLDKSYANYGEGKMMELTHFDGYAMLDAIEFGAKWQEEKDKQVLNKEGVVVLPGEAFERMKRSLIELAEKERQMMAKAIDVTVHIYSGGYPYIPQMELYDYDKDVPLAKEGDKYKVVLIKEE